LVYCIAAAPDPARDYWCANCSIETQATKPRLNQPWTLCSVANKFLQWRRFQHPIPWWWESQGSYSKKKWRYVSECRWVNKSTAY